MKRDHLRLVAAADPAPQPVERIDTFTFAHMCGDLVVLHNDNPCSAPEALVEIMRTVMPSLLSIVGGNPTVKVHQLLPDDVSRAIEFHDGHHYAVSVAAETKGDGA